MFWFAPPSFRLMAKPKGRNPGASEALVALRFRVSLRSPGMTNKWAGRKPPHPPCNFRMNFAV
jgi:hypothetical protein